MKLTTLTRLAPATFDAATLDKKKRTVELAFSSETPVVRFFGDEVLSHDAKSVRLGRFNDGANVLFNHNVDDVIGVVESARIDSDKVGRARVRFAKNARGEEIMGLIDDQILSKTSVRYQIHKVEEKKDGYRVIDWEPLELSIVSMPADASVGVGRAAAEQEIEVEVIVAETSEAAVRDANPQPAKAAPEGNVMTAEVTPAAATPAVPNAPAITAQAAERERQDAILSLARSMNVDARVQAQWVEKGTPLTTVMAELADLQKQRSDVKPVLASEIGLTRRETQKYSMTRAIMALQFGAREPQLLKDAAFEIECSNAIASSGVQRSSGGSILVPAEVLRRPMGAEAAQGMRDMATTPGAKGGYAVDVTNMGFIDILRNRSVAMNMGARVLSGLKGNVSFTRQTGKPSVTWQAGEHVSVTAADQALGQLSASPKTCIAITKVSEQLLRQGTPSVEGFIMADLASDVAIDGVDYVVINGTGGAQPLGIKNTTGVATAQDASSATYAKILAFPSTAGTANALRGNRGFVTNTAGAAILMQKQRFTSTDTPLWDGTLEDGKLVGYRAMSSEQLASGNLIFGSWDEVIICEWGVLELATDNGGTNFNTASVSIRAMWMVDVLVRYPQAFVVSVNLSA